MTDISKCQGKHCDIKHKCYRYTAPAGHWQSYLLPRKPGPDCEFYRKLEMRCLARGGEWRIHRTVNARDPEKAMKYLMKKMIDHPELCTDIDVEWRSALLQSCCIYGEKKFMLDIDTTDRNVLDRLFLMIPKDFLVEQHKSPKGWHWITKPFDTREVCKLSDVSLQRDGYYYIKTVGDS